MMTRQHAINCGQIQFRTAAHKKCRGLKSLNAFFIIKLGPFPALKAQMKVNVMYVEDDVAVVAACVEQSAVAAPLSI